MYKRQGRVSAFFVSEHLLGKEGRQGDIVETKNERRKRIEEETGHLDVW